MHRILYLDSFFDLLYLKFILKQLFFNYTGKILQVYILRIFLKYDTEIKVKYNLLEAIQKNNWDWKNAFKQSLDWDGFDFPFPCHEIGSIRKLNATVLALQGKPLTDKSKAEVNYWWPQLGLGDPKDFFALVAQRPSNPNSKEYGVWEHNILVERLRFNIKFLESTGLDFVYTGEALRREMYEGIAQYINGIILENEHVRSFDDRFYKPGVWVSDSHIDRKQSIYRNEFELAKHYAKHPLRFCLTGPYTTYDWTIKGVNSEDFIFDMVKNVYVPETIEIIKAGAKYITSDEPAYTTKPAERELYIQAYKEYFNGIKEAVHENNVKIGFHTCFSDSYDILFEDLPQLPWDYASLEFANRDLKTPGITDAARPAYAHIMPYVDQAIDAGAKTKYTLGVLEVHADQHFTPEALKSGEAEKHLQTVIRDRIIYQANHLYDKYGSEGLKYILVGPDCGLRPVSEFDTLHLLLRAMVNATKEARTLFTDKWVS